MYICDVLKLFSFKLLGLFVLCFQLYFQRLDLLHNLQWAIFCLLIEYMQFSVPTLLPQILGGDSFRLELCFTPPSFSDRTSLWHKRQNLAKLIPSGGSLAQDETLFLLQEKKILCGRLGLWDTCSLNKCPCHPQPMYCLHNNTQMEEMGQSYLLVIHLVLQAFSNGNFQRKIFILGVLKCQAQMQGKMWHICFHLDLTPFIAFFQEME